MSDARPVNLSASGPPETVLDAEEVEAIVALEAALAAPAASQRDAIAEVVARWPRCLVAWAELGDRGRDDVERYAAYRVGYHRGLDRLRAAGWRGSGFVRSDHVDNQGFLRCVAGLGAMAAAIGEADEQERCTTFLAQLDPQRR